MRHLSSITNIIFKGDSRTALIKKNIAGSLLIKGWSCIVQFLIVPLSLTCLTKYEYGLWLTINSILVGIDSIDVGLGNGLRNKLAESLALGDKESARKYVSSTFFMLNMLMIPIMLILSLCVHNIDCYRLLNVDSVLIPNLDGIIIASLCIMCSTFIFKFIGNMYLGLQLPAINNLLVVTGQTIALVALYVISLFMANGNIDLFTVSLVFTLSPLVIYLVAYPVTFCGKYKFLAPSFRYFDLFTIKELLSLGVSFFVIQITGLLLFTSSNFIISNQLSPEDVTPYQISYRYFSLVFLIFSIIAAPLWSATTDAYTKGEWDWIKNIIRKMNKLLVLCVAILIIMIFCSSIFYRIWTQGKVDVDISLSILMALYIFFLVFSNSYSYILFGIGKIKLMVLATLLECLIFIPIQYYVCGNFGLNGLVITLVVATCFLALVNFIQFKKLSTNTATGIWNK